MKDDSPDLLASDVHRAGAGICDNSAVMKLATEGPRRVEEVLLSGSAEVRNSRRVGRVPTVGTITEEGVRSVSTWKGTYH